MKKINFLLCVTVVFLLIGCEDFFLGPETENNPKNNFNLLWNEFDLYYPSFITKNINWDSLYNVYSDRINEQTTDDELLYIFHDLLKNFNDPHVYLYNYDHRVFVPSCSTCYAHEHEFSLNLIINSYLNGKFSISGGGNFIYGKFPGDSIGYIYLKSFFGSSGWEKDIDMVLSSLNSVNTIIFDLRENHGGEIDKTEYIASAFLKEPLIYAKEIARNGPEHYDLTKPVDHSISPRGANNQFSKNIRVLTNKNSASAAEVMALILGKLDYSVQIGDSTAGGLGVTPRKFMLLNGWTYCMPESIILTADGQSLEGIGVVPDVWIRNSRTEILHDYDAILEYALRLHEVK